MEKSAASDGRRNALDTLVRWIGAGAMAIAAALWFWSASVDASGGGVLAQDQFQRMTELNRYGSAAAVIAAICAMVLFLLKPATRADRS